MIEVHNYSSVAEAFDHFDMFYNNPEASSNTDWVGTWYDLGKDEWAGGTHEQAKVWARHGDPKYGDQIRKAIASLGHVAMPNREHWSAAPVGFLPNVPAYVSGSHNSMWRRTVGEQPRPVRMFVSGFLSGCVSDEVLAERGAAVIALVEYLKSRAPVELYLYYAKESDYCGSKCAMSIRLQSETLDPDVAGFLFCSPASARRFMAPLNAALGGPSSGCPYSGDHRRMVGATSRDILVPCIDWRTNGVGTYTPEWVRRTAEAALKG